MQFARPLDFYHNFFYTLDKLYFTIVNIFYLGHNVNSDHSQGARMTSERAREILRCMANGVDPITGEILEADHLCNSPEVIRAIFAAIRLGGGERFRKRSK